MEQELTVQVGERDYLVFLQDGFYRHSGFATGMHNHHYAEIHMITNGTAQLTAENTHICLKSGSAVLIPRGIYHRCIGESPESVHIAFQLDCDVIQLRQVTVGADLLQHFCNAIANSASCGNYATVSAYLSVIISMLLPEERKKIRPVTDYGFLIHEFLANHYPENLKLSDLAAYLHLSERQCERLVLSYTSHTFRDELTIIRITVAEKLILSGQFNKKEVL